MIVEFLGVPGAGKTTFLPLVREYFRGQRIRAYTTLEAARPFAARTLPGRVVSRLPPGRFRRLLLWWTFYAFSFAYQAGFRREHPELMRSVLNSQARRPITDADRQHVLRWFLHLTGTYGFLKAYARPGDLVIFDEGFVHRVVQLFASENEIPEMARVKRYLDLIPAPDLVIYPRASSQVCEQRVIARGLWERFESKEDGAASRFIRSAEIAVDLAAEYVQTKGWKVIEVENNGGPLPESESMLRRGLRLATVAMMERVGS